VSFPSKRPRPQIVEWLMGAWLNLDRQSITSAPGGPQQPPDGP
jgi:hypothetical protein